MLARTLARIALPLLTAVSSNAQSAPQPAEAYEVYSAVIPQVQSAHQPKFLIASDTVAYADTESRFPVEPEKLVTKEEFDEQLKTLKGTPEWKKIKKGEPCILVPDRERNAYLSAMRDYRRKNAVSVKLEPKFNPSKTYRLISVPGLSDDKRVKLAEQGGANGVYTLSAVGFSTDMTMAIVYVGFDCPLCGRWAVHVLRKTNEKWQEVTVGCSWLS